MPRAATVQDWVTLFALTVFWGTSFLFNEVALTALPPETLVAARIALGTAALLVFFLASGCHMPRDKRTWGTWVVIAILGVILPMRLTAWGQQFIGSAETGVLMAISPLFVYTLSHFFLPGERLTVFRLIGFLFGFAGVVLVIGPSAPGGWAGNAPLVGALAVLGAAFSYSVNSIYARRCAPQNPMALSTGMMMLAALMTMPEGLLGLREVTFPLSVMPLVALAILGLICSGFAAVLYFKLVQGPGPAFVTLITYLVPVWAVLAGAVVLQETLSKSMYLGLVLILGGIALSELAPRLKRGLRGSLAPDPIGDPISATAPTRTRRATAE